jgi:hypothetical protein
MRVRDTFAGIVVLTGACVGCTHTGTVAASAPPNIGLAAAASAPTDAADAPAVCLQAPFSIEQRAVITHMRQEGESRLRVSRVVGGTKQEIRRAEMEARLARAAGRRSAVCSSATHGQVMAEHTR